MISGQSAGFLFFLFCFLVSERMFYSSDVIESETSSPVITVSRTACVFLFFPPLAAEVWKGMYFRRKNENRSPRGHVY